MKPTFYMLLLFVLAMVALSLCSCCSPTEGSTRGQALSFSLLHPGQDNPHCESDDQ